MQTEADPRSVDHAIAALAVLPRRAVERAFDQAEVLGLLDFADLGRVLQEGAARPGAAKLRWVVARDAAGSTVTATRLEELTLAI